VSTKPTEHFDPDRPPKGKPTIDIDLVSKISLLPDWVSSVDSLFKLFVLWPLTWALLWSWAVQDLADCVGAYIPKYPTILRLFGYFLPKSIRERVYDPVRNELLEDYYETRRFRSRSGRLWLGFCFTFRLILLVLECCRAVMADSTVHLVLMTMPPRIREWWGTNKE